MVPVRPMLLLRLANPEIAMTRLPLTIAMAVLWTFAQAANSSAALPGGNSAVSMAAPSRADGAIEIAANYIYRLRNKSSSDCWAQLLTTGFPAISLTPALRVPKFGVVHVPLPYPDVAMKTRCNGTWSAASPLKWRSGLINLPSL
jgi:hypothetical protein